MALNDILSTLVEKMGLKKSDRRRCEEAIAEHEYRIKDLDRRLAGLVEEARTVERRLRELKVAYDAATVQARGLLEAQIRSGMRDFARIRELQTLTLRNQEKEKTLLNACRLELENLDHPTDEVAVDEARSRKEDLQDEDETLADLDNLRYDPHESAIDTAGASEMSVSVISDLDALLDGKTNPSPSDSTPDVA